LISQPAVSCNKATCFATSFPLPLFFPNTQKHAFSEWLLKCVAQGHQIAPTPSFSRPVISFQSASNLFFFFLLLIRYAFHHKSGVGCNARQENG
jgi:hypothetical protein